MPFTLTVIPSSSKDITHLAAQGQATAVDFSPERGNLLDAALGADWSAKLLLLNMEKVTYLDSSAIGWLLTCQKTCRANGGFLVLHSLCGSIRNILDLLKVGRIVPLAPDAPAGTALLKEHVHPVHV